MSLIRKVRLLLVLAVMPLVLSACATVTPITAERPKDEAFRTELKKEISSLNLVIDASTDEIAKTLNQAIGKELYKGSTRYSGLTADVVKNGPITVTASDNFLHLTIPITVALKYSMFEAPPIAFKVKFKMSASVTPDWKLNAEVYYTGLSDLLAEEIGVGPIKFKPRSIIEGVAQSVQKSLSEVISRKITEKHLVKDQVAKVWLAAQKPVLLDRNYSAWLKITPKEVMLFPLYAQNNQVKLSLGLKTFAELVVGPEPKVLNLVPLPNLTHVTSMDRTFRIPLNVDLYYKDLVSIASPLLLNKELGSDGKSIVLKELDVYGNGDKLVVKVVATGTVDGTFYLTGRPVFDPKTNMFSVADVDFDMNSQSVLVQTAGWLLHGTIRSKIQEKLTMDLTPKLDQSREAAQKAIARVKLVENIYLRGTIKTIKLNDLLVQKDHLSVQVYTEGESAVLFQ